MSVAASPKDHSAFTATRCFPVAGADTSRVENALAGLEGVEEVGAPPCRNGVAVRYDAARVSYADIERTLVQADIPLRHNRWTRIKAGWFRFVDENTKSNASSKGGACCSRPPGIYGGRRKN